LKGCLLVHEHESNCNAQEVYQKLISHHLHSTRARIDASSLL
jgi:hypothetical protein